MLSAHDVVRELRQRLPRAGVLKIHKLAYYSQGWHLTWTGEPMFAEEIGAWEHGPVVADVWHDEKRNRLRPTPQRLGDEELAVVDYVIERYGAFSGRELETMTHGEDPWRAAWREEERWRVANRVISHDALASFFERDDEYQAHKAEVRRLRELRDVYGFGEPAMPERLRAATLRMLAERP